MLIIVLFVKMLQINIIDNNLKKEYAKMWICKLPRFNQVCHIQVIWVNKSFRNYIKYNLGYEIQTTTVLNECILILCHVSNNCFQDV